MPGVGVFAKIISFMARRLPSLVSSFLSEAWAILEGLKFVIDCHIELTIIAYDRHY